jgi:hypothetical protein
MAWFVPLIGMAAGATMGGIEGYKKQEADKKQRRLLQLSNAYAPFYGKSPQIGPAEQDYVTQGLMGGGIKGFEMGQSAMGLFGGGGGEAAQAAAAPEQGPVYSPGTGQSRPSGAPGAPWDIFPGEGQSVDPNYNLYRQVPDAPLGPEYGPHPASYYGYTPEGYSTGHNMYGENLGPYDPRLLRR